MDIGTVIGLALGTLAILGGIMVGGELSTFIDIPSVIIVGMGVSAATLIKWPLELVKGFPNAIKKIIFFTAVDLKETIEELGSLADTARRESVFALEKVPIEDPFLKKAMTLAADNRPPEVIYAILQMEVEAMGKRHKKFIDVVDGMGLDGPAFGMIGTLIGLVKMLQNLSDPSAIGPAMAVALLTTFYGAVGANLFAGPMKSKLLVRSENETSRMNMIVAGTLGIVAGENPRLIKEKLSSYLPPNDRSQEEAGE